MTTAATLPEAAGLAFDNLQVFWLIGAQFKLRLSQFWHSSRAAFPDGDPNGRPVSNWLILIAGLEDVVPSGQGPITQLNLAAQYVYRICWMAEALRLQGLISNAQAADLLSNYNGSFG